MRLLLVEDEVQLAESIERSLVHESFAVDVLHDGHKALERIQIYRNDYDAVILDLTLPGIDGEKICSTAREQGVSTPILILTARPEQDIKIRMLKTHADDYLQKPFSIDELIARLRAILRRPYVTQLAILAVGNLMLDTATRTVTYKEEVLPLTLKEYALLEYLMHRPDRVVQREDIIDNIWDMGFSSFTNVLEVHMKNLRKKMGYEGRDAIQTVRGIGYRLIDLEKRNSLMPQKHIGHVTHRR